MMASVEMDGIRADVEGSLAAAVISAVLLEVVSLEGADDDDELELDVDLAPPRSLLFFFGI